ncbi:hypothetical protein F5144DRAFT_496097 [Chaetomium tenue]|uniref:Uncharacterized protein n=1 Tax=Chaetomium tenue TaxID=1854479 RepID=A0ACB7P325_9PEZI|nr:hypothetical protein F5144DRAFT_496097 [Chaetomium globosum]
MSFQRFLQVDATNAPNRSFTTLPGLPFVPSESSYTQKSKYKSLMATVYGKTHSPAEFASLYLEGEDYLRARITISKAHEVLILDNLKNARAGDKKYLKVKHLIANSLAISGVRATNINLLVIQNIDNRNTKDLIRQYQASEGWEPGTWLFASDAHKGPLMATELGRTAKSLATKLGKHVGGVYVGEILGQPALAFGLQGSRPPTPVTYPPPRPAPGRPASPPNVAYQANPRPPTPVKRGKSCGCIVC